MAYDLMIIIKTKKDEYYEKSYCWCTFSRFFNNVFCC